MNCTIDDCDKPAKTRGWCWMHYGRWRRHGDPNIKSTYVRVPPAVWVDPLTEDDYKALQAAVEADAQKLLPIVKQFILSALGPEGGS